MLFYEKKNDVYFEVCNDEYAENPRTMSDYNSTFITFEKHYKSPDDNKFESFEEMLESFGTDHTGHMRNDLDSLMKNALAQGVVLLPVWKYEHSGVSYCAAEHYPFQDRKPTSTPGYEGGWDGGLCGVIYEKIEGQDVEKIKSNFASEIDEYNKWANGEIYIVSVYSKTAEEIDSVGQIYNDYCSIEDMITDISKEYFGIEVPPGIETPFSELEEVGYEYGYEYAEIDEELDPFGEEDDYCLVHYTVEERIAQHQENLNCEINNEERE